MKKLIPAMCALLVATALLGTSTFAWFSMNREVSATGMQVTANSNSVFLLIGSGDNDTYTEIQNAGTITTELAVDAEAAKLYPAAHATITNTTDADNANVQHETGYYYLTSDSTQKITKADWEAKEPTEKENYTKEVTDPFTNWFYKIADAPTASTSSKAPTYLTSTTGYVIHKTCYVTLAAGSNDATNLRVSALTLTSNNTATAGTYAPVKVLVTSPTAAVELDSTTTSSDTVLAATLTDDAVVQIDIYIYYDGNHSSVYTANVANLDGANISITFDVD